MDAKAKKILAAYKKQGARVETRARVRLKAKKDFSLYSENERPCLRYI